MFLNFRFINSIKNGFLFNVFNFINPSISNFVNLRLFCICKYFKLINFSICNSVIFHYLFLILLITMVTLIVSLILEHQVYLIQL